MILVKTLDEMSNIKKTKNVEMSIVLSKKKKVGDLPQSEDGVGKLNKASMSIKSNKRPRSNRAASTCRNKCEKNNDVTDTENVVKKSVINTIKVKNPKLKLEYPVTELRTVTYKGVSA